ncbi:MAG: PBP1A family penicillin-binding protein [Deltaproteobacteria bacterium]|nr:PBP1A family penicillin-binding protein [Deltaproteobacteria bacterium]
MSLIIISAAAVSYGVYSYFANGLPSLKTLEEYNPNIITKVYSDDGQIIGEFYTERRIVIPISSMPRHLINAFLAAEDARFFKHEGIDYMSIMRAFYKNLFAGKIVQGGSTITQQVAKSFFLTPERSISRKIREMILAHRIERNLSKEEILHLYLNQIYLGNGAYGVQAASETYFGKDAKEINIAEAALLAGLPKAPSRYSPYYNPQTAKERQHYVIKRMEEAGFIKREDAERSIKYGIKLKPKEVKSLWVGHYFTEHVRRYVEDKYGEDLLYRGGLKIYTTLNVELQKAANLAVANGLKEYDRRHGYRGPLGHLSSKDEMTKFIEEVDGEIIKKPLETSKIYRCVVTAVNPQTKVVTVMLGNRKGEIRFDDIQWAKLYNPTNDPDAGKHLKDINQIIKKGDILLVNIKELPEKEKGTIILTLEQEPIAQASIVAIEPSTGYIRALVGGSDFSKTQFNRVIQSRRQPGSAFKPIIYAGAIDKGWTPASVIMDSPIVFEETIKGEEDWRPQNFDQKFYGPITFRSALTHSRNVVSIKILQDIGVGYAIDYARRLGIMSPLARNLSIALGSSGVSLMELTNAFAVFANQGKRVEPFFIKKITDKAGNIIEENTTLTEDVISTETAFIMTNLLQAVIQEGTGQRAKALGRPAAGKTGTTNNLNDAWFIGYTPDLAAGAWIGYDDERPLGHAETGARAALPIWLYFMQKAVERTPVKNFAIPEGIVFAKIDAMTGKLASQSPDRTIQGQASDKIIFEAFKQGTAPTEFAVENTSVTSRSSRFFEEDSGSGGGKLQRFTDYDSETPERQ